MPAAKKPRASRPTPTRSRAGRAHVVVSTRGVTVDGNRAALRGLAECVAWAADQPASEHAEVHVPWHLDPPQPGRRRSFTSARLKGRPVEFELPFIAVESKDLDRFQAGQPRKY